MVVCVWSKFTYQRQISIKTCKTKMNSLKTLFTRTKLFSTIALYFPKGLHANRAEITRIKRPSSGYLRQFPTKLVFKDGSTITFRHHVPREIVKLPLLLEECQTEAERKAWYSRRKPIEVIEVKKDDTAVRFDQKQYLTFLKKKVSKNWIDWKCYFVDNFVVDNKTFKFISLLNILRIDACLAFLVSSYTL